MKVTPTEGSCIMEDSVIITKGQYEKLTNPELQPRICAAALDYHLKFNPEKTGNVNHNTVTRTKFGPTDNSDFRKLEDDHGKFLEFIDSLEIPQPEEESDLLDFNDEEDDLEFCKEILAEWDERPVISGGIMVQLFQDNPNIHMKLTDISRNLLKEMFQLYVQAHDHKEKPAKPTTSKAEKSGH